MPSRACVKTAFFLLSFSFHRCSLYLLSTKLWQIASLVHLTWILTLHKLKFRWTIRGHLPRTTFYDTHEKQICFIKKYSYNDWESPSQEHMTIHIPTDVLLRMFLQNTSYQTSILYLCVVFMLCLVNIFSSHRCRDTKSVNTSTNCHCYYVFKIFEVKWWRHHFTIELCQNYYFLFATKKYFI